VQKLDAATTSGNDQLAKRVKKMAESSIDEIAIEQQLLRDIRAGNQESFAAFYDRVAPLLFTVAYRILNQREAAEDVLQEAFLLIWQRARQFDPAKGRPLNWAVTLTRNKALDRLRSTQRQLRIREAAAQAAEFIAPDEAPTGLEATASHESHDRIQTALAGLPPSQRTVVQMVFLSSHTVKETAERLGEPLGTVKSHLRRGLLRLRRALGEGWEQANSR